MKYLVFFLMITFTFPVLAGSVKEGIPKGAFYYHNKGIEYGSLREFKEAEAQFKKALEIDNSFSYSQMSLRVIKDLEKGVINEDYALLIFEGSDYLIKDKMSLAVGSFKKAIQINPDYMMMHIIIFA